MTGHHGKADVNVITRYGDGFVNCQHDLSLIGDEMSEYHGDNSLLVTTDTLKNVILDIYSKNSPPDDVLKDILSAKFEGKNDNNTRAKVDCNEMTRDFVEYRKFCPERVVMGFRNLKLIKMQNSAFANFRRDNNFTTLKDTPDRPLYITMDAEWRCNANISTTSVVENIVKMFDEYGSNSVQDLLFKMYEKLNITDIRFKVKNNHYIKLSNHSLVPLHNDYGYFAISFGSTR